MSKIPTNSIYSIALIFAAKEGNAKLIKQLLAKRADTKAINSHGNTALIMACQESNLEIVNLLIHAGSDIHAANAIGNTGLLYAAYNGRSEIVKSLVHAGAQPNVSNTQGNTPLIYAAYNGYLAILQFLIEEAKADIDQQDNEGRSALMWAIIRGKTDVTLYLLSKNAAKLTDSLGFTTLDWARVMERSDIEKILNNLIQ